MAEDEGGFVCPIQYCPHLHNNIRILPERLAVDKPCRDCNSTQENWICLHCYQTRCSRYVNEHAEHHWLSTTDPSLPTTDPDCHGHCIALSLTDLSVWCFACASYVKHDIIQPLLVRAEAMKFNKPITGAITKPPAFQTAFFYEKTMNGHKSGNAHSLERPDRTENILNHLSSTCLLSQCRGIVSRMATNEELLQVHSYHYVDKLMSCADSASAQEAMVKEDVYFGPGSLDAVLVAAGGLMEVVGSVCKGETKNGFALIRPPGHHANKDGSSGFCIVNNVAVAVKHAQQKFGLQKILILDWDVHHGDGTQEIFYDDKGVTVISIHAQEHAPGLFYPEAGNAEHMGGPAAPGQNINIPLPYMEDGYSDGDYLAIFDSIVLPIITEVAPQLIMVSAGFDAAKLDPVGLCHLTPQFYSKIMISLTRFAEGRVILALEGGYGPNTPHCVDACLRVLLGQKDVDVKVSSAIQLPTLLLCNKLRRSLSKYWKYCRDEETKEKNDDEDDEEQDYQK